MRKTIWKRLANGIAADRGNIKDPLSLLMYVCVKLDAEDAERGEAPHPFEDDGRGDCAACGDSIADEKHRDHGGPAPCCDGNDPECQHPRTPIDDDSPQHVLGRGDSARAAIDAARERENSK